MTFEITGYGGDVEAHWDFGGAGCAPYVQTEICEPIYTSCLDSTYKYASAGAKTVTVTAYQPGTTTVIGTALVNLTVQTSGTCGGCTYTLSPTSRDFPAAGGTGTVNVATNAGCGWTADPSHSWITISSGGSGTGNGTVNYSVDRQLGRGASGQHRRREPAPHRHPSRGRRRWRRRWRRRHQHRGDRVVVDGDGSTGNRC